MANEQDEKDDLAMADRHIRESRERIAKQEEVIEDLTAKGHDTVTAMALLQTFRETLNSFVDHRILIVEELEKLAARTIPIKPA